MFAAKPFPRHVNLLDVVHQILFNVEQPRTVRALELFFVPVARPVTVQAVLGRTLLATLLADEPLVGGPAVMFEGFPVVKHLGTVWLPTAKRFDFLPRSSSLLHGKVFRGIIARRWFVLVEFDFLS